MRSMPEVSVAGAIVTSSTRAPKGPAVPENTLEIALPVVIVLISLSVVAFTLRGIRGVTTRIKNGVAGTAVVQGIGETGTTISAPGVGPEAPVYRIQLQVLPPMGTPYEVEIKQAVPRIHVPFFRPGLNVPVDIDAQRADRVRVAFDRIAAGGGATVVGGTGAVGGAPGVSVTFMDNRPVDGLGEVLAAVRDGSMPTNRGSAAELLRTGTRGIAEITSAMPLGKKTRDVFPDAAPDVADDPLWMLTVTVDVPGQPQFPAVFGHRVPRSRVAQVAPGLRLPVAVDLADRNSQVAVDWDALPV